LIVGLDTLRTVQEDKFGADEAGDAGGDIGAIQLARVKPWYTRLLHLVLVVLSVGAAASLIFLSWWHLSLRGLGPAASVYEQMQRLGRLLGVPQEIHQTPVEYGESLIQMLGAEQEQVRHIVASYVKHRYARSGLSRQEEELLSGQWQQLRAHIWRQIWTLRRTRPERKQATWVPSSALRPPGALG